ncbi:dioxygenase [Spirilliplanes yamanashiensis]|uniref:Dioxygenase n=1 Tax=Spirilliplanes yamanashiensis TaxID=42233 RepID=A0A8J3YCW1_9ACTN|nr:dioxygenase [Spirilliplanes yamanashiensis]
MLVVSAHWYIQATAITTMARPRTIHDFFGFPQELFDAEYPAPGLPELADEIADVVEPVWIGRDVDSWGLDHGTWSVLRQMFPAADVPVVQLSVNATKPLGYHLDLGARLAPLRERGVMIVGSGNVVHNLRILDRAMGESGFDWAHRFDDAVRDRMTADPAEVAGMTAHPDFGVAAELPDHFLPLAYLAGLAAAAGRGTGVLTDGYLGGSLSMTAYTLDAPPLPAGGGGAAGAVVPSGVPADGANV